MEDDVQGAGGLAHVYEHEQDARQAGGHRDELAQHRDLGEGPVVMQVVWDDHHHRRGRDPDEEGELRDV